MSFRDFLAEKYPEVTGKIKNGENISCPNIEDFLAYIADTNIVDISGVDFSKDQPIVVENRGLVCLVAENADYEGGVTLKSVIVAGNISFYGSKVEKVLSLLDVKCAKLIFPENVENISVTEEVTISSKI